ncbi:MAG: SDR family oxidoreductase [Gammaproteobacteria bacterium]|nr:SDR family oxidoreductase [Gammaproteobacteria bacterium]MCY4218578.1 SDR family oxidoreductase [Gammaproteobacteria bacterium]MCY4275717.1 SDR family oxidoreductase [Gammaproteobacteria bacterium]
MNFDGQSVLITAGVSGIGRAIALGFYNAGASVHVMDIDKTTGQQFAEAVPEIMVSIGDASNESQTQCIAEQHIYTYGGIDVLVNCVGIAGPTSPVQDVSLDDWHRCMAVNLDSTFLYCRALIPNMRSAGRGSIINISSTAGWHGYPLRSPYAASKWAVIGLTKTLAMELGPYGIRANVICPGSINGDRMDRVIHAESEQSGRSQQDVRNKYTNSCSLRTFIDAEDISRMALFLASSDASRITGQIMNVDGHIENFGS